MPENHSHGYNFHKNKFGVVSYILYSVGAETNVHNSQEAIIDIKYF